MESRNREHYLTAEKEINMKDFYDVIKRRAWIIILLTIVATVGGFYLNKLNDNPMYQSSARIIVGPDSQMQTLMVVIKDQIIMESVIEELQLNKTTDQLASQVQVERVDDSQVISISVTDAIAKQAAAIANVTATIFKNEVGTILGFDDVEVLSEAKESPLPINENTNKAVVFAAIFGFATGIGLVFLLDVLDGTIAKNKELEEILGVPVIGVISNMNSKRKVESKSKKSKVIEVRGDAVDIK
ncbi:YveK family protein [Virgibacillus sp. W0430]|uniref:YveK family protein n=1 Tax=Virgibacillus sp. W0430 TaxID=3391580 RepID=UPI003F4756D7